MEEEKSIQALVLRQEEKGPPYSFSMLYVAIIAEQMMTNLGITHTYNLPVSVHQEAQHG